MLASIFCGGFVMGLIDDRALKAYREFVFPRWKNELEVYLGFPVNVEVEWNSLVSPGRTVWCFQHLTEIYFLPLRYALEAAAYDELGRNALRETLKSICIKNTGSNFDCTSMVSFNDGILTIDHTPDTNLHEIYQRAEAILLCIEAKL